MTAQVTDVGRLVPIDRDEARRLGAEENERVVALLTELEGREWSRPTDCPGWDVRAMASHLLGGMEADVSVREWLRQMLAARRAAAAAGLPLVDGLTRVQVASRAHLGPDALLRRLTELAPRAAAARAAVPGLLRRLPMTVEFAGARERWRLGYLLDVIATRDVWMHRVDLARATGRDPVLTAEHDGRIVADVVAEWAARHGSPFTLHLTGPAGGTFVHGAGADAGAEQLTVDAVEFCRVLSGRGQGDGLLARPVPF